MPSVSFVQPRWYQFTYTLLHSHVQIDATQYRLYRAYRVSPQTETVQYVKRQHVYCTRILIFFSIGIKRPIRKCPKSNKNGGDGGRGRHVFPSYLVGYSPPLIHQNDELDLEDQAWGPPPSTNFLPQFLRKRN